METATRFLVGEYGLLEIPADKPVGDWVRHGYVRDLGDGMYEITEVGKYYFWMRARYG